MPIYFICVTDSCEYSNVIYLIYWCRATARKKKVFSLSNAKKIV